MRTLIILLLISLMSCQKKDVSPRKMKLKFYSDNGNISYTLPSRTGQTYKNTFEVEFIVTDKLMEESMYIEAKELEVYVNGSFIHRYPFSQVFKKTIPVSNLYYGS